MRRLIRWAGRIKASRHSDEQGSIIVEAAIVAPLLMMVLVAFIVFIQLCAVQMALYAAASQTVRQVAAHIHPVSLAWNQVVEKSQNDESSSSSSEPYGELPEWSEVAAQATEWLPEPAGTLISSALRGDWQPLQNMAATEIGRNVIEPFIRENIDEAILDPNRIRLELLTLPDLKHKEKPYIGIALQYEFPLKLPLLNKPIMLHAQASERVWISDRAAAAYGSQSNAEENASLQIVSIEPSPLRPGRKATAVVKTSPGAVVSLEVLYKSGSSKAKHLGEATADESGFVQWTWHVSGNTTPGIWQLTATAADNVNGSVSKHFVVEKNSAPSGG